MFKSVIGLSLFIFITSSTFAAEKQIQGPVEFKFNRKELVKKAIQTLSMNKEFNGKNYDLVNPVVAAIIGKDCDGQTAKWQMVVFPANTNAVSQGNAYVICPGNWDAQSTCGRGTSIQAGSSAVDDLLFLVEQHRDLRKSEGGCGDL